MAARSWPASGRGWLRTATVTEPAEQPVRRVRDDLEAVVAQAGDLARRVVIVDFDGTLSRIVADPGDAALISGAREALAGLLDTPVEVAVLSGRPLADVEARLEGLPVLVVGGHGAEARLPDGSHVDLVDHAGLHATLDRAAEAVTRLVGRRAGWQLERKPHSLAVHHRRAGPESAGRLDEVVGALERHTDEPPGWEVLGGKAVVELRPRLASKHHATHWIAARFPGRVPLVIGDDVTDEEAFAAAAELGGAGVLVELVPRRTAARWRVENPDRVVELLRRLGRADYERRSPARAGGGGPPAEHAIESYGLISDSRTAGLVSPDGSVDWLCLPRFDSPSVFAALLDPRRGGRWRIRPADRDGLGIQRTYLGDTNVLVTRFVRDGDPLVTLTDFLVYSRVNAFDPTHTGHVLIRRVEAVVPTRLEVEFQPRFDYGRARTRMEATAEGLRAWAGTDELTLSVPGLAWEVTSHEDGNGQVGRAWPELAAGEQRWFVMGTASAHRGPHSHLPPRELLDLTVRTWGRWSDKITFDGPWRDAVVRSALVLKGLIYEPTGAMVAAPTTSLPETPTGVRNWDYRYAWIRDSAYGLESFLRLGHTREAETFVRWLGELTHRIGGAAELRPLYRITGEEDLTEFAVEQLAGYRGSRPVRVGNSAAMQRQLDIYGAAVQLGYLTDLLGSEVPPTRWSIIVQLIDTVADRWRMPDSGLWEIRSPPRTHTYSRFQCWLAVDRAIKIGRSLGLAAPYGRWQKLADEIAADVLTYGWNDEVGAFTQSYGSTALDASLLLLPLRRLVPPCDERVASTVAAIRRRLEVTDGVLLRYRSDDGLPGQEGGVLLCSFWLVAVLAEMGQLDEAERLFDRLVALAGPLGLYAEQIDPRTHTHLGNFPQAFTHMGLITAATTLTDGQRGGGRGAGRHG